MESRAKHAAILLYLMFSFLECSRYALYKVNSNYSFWLPYNWNNNASSHFECAMNCLGQARCTSFFFSDGMSSCIFDCDVIVVSPPKIETDAWTYYYRSRNLINAAFNKSVTMSSRYNNIYNGSFATDGTIGQFTHTNREVSPWLKIYLGNSFEIDRVILYNRQDQMGERLHNVEITAGSDASLFPFYCGGFIRASETAQTVQVVCKTSFSAGYIRIQIVGKAGEGNYLSLSEVEIFAFLN